MNDPRRACTQNGDPVCVGAHVIADDQEFYTINPVGGYGLDEVLCCTACITRPGFEGFRKRMVEAGAVELA